MRYYLLLLFCILNTALSAQFHYRNAALSFDCTGDLALKESGEFFWSSACKGFAHLSYGYWKLEDDSVLVLRACLNEPF